MTPRHRQARLGGTAILVRDPEPLSSVTGRGPRARGALIFRTGPRGRWTAATWQTWSKSCAALLSELHRGARVEFEARFSFGAFEDKGRPRVRFWLQLERLARLDRLNCSDVGTVMEGSER